MPFQTILVLCCLIVLLIILILQFKKPTANPDLILNQERMKERLRLAQESTEKQLIQNRTDANETAKANREELQKSLATNRQELGTVLEKFEVSFSQNVKDFNDLQKQKFDDLLRKQEFIRKETEEKLTHVRETVEKKLTSIQEDNEKRLEKMRQTVDEKLQETLDKRLSESFKLVSERLEAVQKGLGDMQQLASGVGDLKKVLTNVKTRGTLGEIQLGNILEQIMTPEQYESNVKTKKGSDALVEFAIKLPGKNSEEHVYLPIDAKFPQEDFIRLQDAYDAGDPATIEQSSKALSTQIKKSAKDIKDKYISPPETTEFAILFLPIEGLYAEVVRQPSLLEELQRKHKVVVAGPTTLAAMLNSLQMGFKTLAIQKQSSEVWEVLTAVKSEFGKFGEVLAKAQKKLEGASKDLESLQGTRTNVINRKLRNVQTLPSPDDSPDLLEPPFEATE